MSNSRRPTFAEAKSAIWSALRDAGWSMSDPHLKVRHATSPDGDLRLWFKAQAVYESQGRHTLSALAKIVPPSRMGHFDTPMVVQEIFRQGEGDKWDFEPATRDGGMEVVVDDGGQVDDWSDIKVRVRGDAKWSSDGKFTYDVEVTIPDKCIVRMD